MSEKFSVLRLAKLTLTLIMWAEIINDYPLSKATTVSSLVNTKQMVHIILMVHKKYWVDNTWDEDQ